jgi:cytochrome c-type biogenesis protein CcmE
MNKIIVKIPRKTRAHNVLFFHDTPYKPKRVELKTRYKRQEKHKKSADLG